MLQVRWISDQPLINITEATRQQVNNSPEYPARKCCRRRDLFPIRIQRFENRSGCEERYHGTVYDSFREMHPRADTTTIPKDKGTRVQRNGVAVNGHEALRNELFASVSVLRDKHEMDKHAFSGSGYITGSLATALVGG